jgi:hypothetical protein
MSKIGSKIQRGNRRLSRSSALWFRNVLAVLAAAGGIVAQTTTGSITGLVMDAGGHVVPGSILTVTNVDINQVRKQVANEIGAYTFAALPPGNYRLELEHPGFKRFVQEPVVVRVQQTVTINIPLEVGQVTQTIEVTGRPELLDAATSSLSQVVENREVTELPLNGRNTLALVALTPGVRTQAGFLQNTAVRSYAGWGNFSTNGGLSGANAVLVDGAPVTMFALNAPSLIPSVDATQEFRVETNNYSAEFGRSAGSVVNVGIKSGTNQLHGSLYEFVRNDKLDANDFFQNRAGQPRPKLTYNQYGFSIGGPVTIPKVYRGRDKTFFFANFEGFRQRLAPALTTSVPTPAQLQGDFSQTFNSAGQLVVIGNPFSVQTGPSGTPVRNPFPGNIIPASMIDPVADILRQNQHIWALPDVPGNQFTHINNFVTSATQPNNEDQIIFRVDHSFHGKWLLFGTGSEQKFMLGGFDPFRNHTDFSTVGGNEQDTTQTAVVGLTALFAPGLVGEFHSSIARYRNNRIPPSNGLFNIATLGFPPSLAAQAQFQTYPRFNFSTVASLGKLTSSEIRRVTDNYAETGSIAWTHGAHEVKFGAEYRIPQFNDIQSDDPTGNYSFSSAFTSLNPFASSSTSGNDVASLLLGIPSSGTMGQALYLALERKYVAGFVQDRWKVTRTLTLNPGFRYEIEYSPTERHNYLSYFDFKALAPIVKQAGLNTPGAQVPTTNQQRSPENTYYRQFGPRFGFAWQATHTTVVRGGYGILWLPGGIEITGGGSNNPTAQLSTALVSSLDGGVTPFTRLSNPFPQGLIAPGNAAGLNSLIGQSDAAFNLGQHSGYSGQWNFDIQHQITPTFAADVAYAGSHSIDLPASLQIDQLPDQYLSLGTALTQQVPNPFYGLISIGALSQPTVSRGQLLRPYPQFNGVTLGYTSLGNSIYHSMQVKLTKRFSTSLISLAYTLSKGIGNAEAATGYLEQNGVPGFQDNNNIRLDRSLNTLDNTHRLLIAFTTELPFGKGKKWLNGPTAINKLVSGWEANGLYTYESGSPLFLGTSTNITNSFGGGSRPNNNGTSAALPGDALSRLNQWFNTSVFSQPPAFTFGSTGRALPDVRNDKMNNLDFGLNKNNRFLHDGRVNLQFRMEFFNILNHPRFHNPGLTFGTPQFGVVSAQVNEPRLVQVALKLLF